MEVHPGELPRVAAALDGSGPALAPLRPGMPSAVAADARVPDDVALVVTTSGSTGEPRAVLLDVAALRASADATHDRLGGPGRWLLTLPLHHVAGLQVVVRSLLAGAAPVSPPAGDGFDPAAVAAHLAALPPDERPRYGSVVPTQLHRIVALAGRDLRPWADLDAILVGGAATAPALLARARDAGLRVVTTYGATETSGGCVYDGVPLAAATARIADGVVHLGGPTLARGYLGRLDLDAATFVTAEGARWFRTGDLGELHDGVLRVLGRADDVIVTGGVKVAPAAVEAVLAELPGVAQVCVVGVPDDEWGSRVVAVVVPGGGRVPDLAEVRAVVRRTLGAAAAPRRVVLADALPERGPGKVDRAGVAALAASQG
ncbi:O-succinylbenzoic acid--CoA ligase [Actinotalea fermentans]|uniref:O-succinylbenzoic acid--CoA ligase n=1 Tax=Actinotalea fermentans TaxID=43671 RepID=A0A511Z0G1_9CELL|nr:O-succinylbenzoic acid--CoA ligase [Actinotalea fermentans]